MESGIIRQTLEAIDKKDYSLLAKSRYSEEQLRNIARGINKRDARAIAAEIINKYIEEYNNADYDWNMGSILSHFDFGIILSILENIEQNKMPFLYDSIGLTWLLGESNSKNKTVINFLENVISYSRNSTAWWNAAYSLKEIDNRNAINILKARMLKTGLKDLNYYLNNLKDKKSLIGILIYSDNTVIKNIIYPKLIEKLPTVEREEKVNIIWLLGRLHLFNTKAFNLVQNLLETTEDYELTYQIFKAMEENPSKEFYYHFKRYLKSNRLLLVKLSIRGIAKVGNLNDVPVLKEMVMVETDESLISELTKTIYILEEPTAKRLVDLKYKYNFNENGQVYDKTNNWYNNPDIYDVFSNSEDSNHLVFRIIEEELSNRKHKVINPVDLATGTGRTLKLIYENLDYEGTLYGVDNSNLMLDYLNKTLESSKSFVKPIQLIETTIENLILPEKSSLIVSSFGFPSKSSNVEQTYQELKSVCNNLTDDGIFITYGWDEYFNDELIEMWYKYVPDDISANTFEHWSTKKAKMYVGARNCNLKWFKRRVETQLKFNSLEDSVKIMGYLFGRDVIDEIINQNKTTWWLSLGITLNTKKEIEAILEEYNNERN